MSIDLHSFYQIIFTIKSLLLWIDSHKYDIIKKNIDKEIIMSVSYKKLLHMMIEKDISNQELMRQAKISANIITKLRTGQYIALDKLESTHEILVLLTC